MAGLGGPAGWAGWEHSLDFWIFSTSALRPHESSREGTEEAFLKI